MSGIFCSCRRGDRYSLVRGTLDELADLGATCAVRSSMGAGLKSCSWDGTIERVRQRLQLADQDACLPDVADFFVIKLGLAC